MDPQKIFDQEGSVIQAAPWLSLVLMAVGAVAAWWFKSKTTASEIAGLKAHLAARDERVKLGEERLADIRLKEETLNT